MKKNTRKTRRMLRRALTCALVCAFAFTGGLTAATLTTRTADAENAVEPLQDTSPAIYVAEKNANSVVGIITSTQSWNRSTGEAEETPISQGSGVVIAEGGYVLTNFHVVEDGQAFKILMPDDSKVDATLAGSDSSLDLAVLKISERADELVPVSIGSTSNLKVGSTVIAIGNPGGEVLANTVTQGIVSALQRTSVNSSNTSRDVEYIQHDASISSGNSGGGLFDYKGNLVGINTLKYGGSYYSNSSYEGLGFAIPVDTAYPIAQQLITKGKVIRPQMGITVSTYEGPNEPMTNYAPASVLVQDIAAGSPAEEAGMKKYDFITEVNGERVTTIRELTTLMDKYNAGDTITVKVVRYSNVGYVNNGYNNNYGNSYGNFFGFPFGFGFGDYYGNGGSNGNGNGGNGSGGGDNGYYSDGSNGGTFTVGGTYETIELRVTLELPEE